MRELKDLLINYAGMSESQKTPANTSEQSDIYLEPWKREVEGIYEAMMLVDRKATDPNNPGFDGQDVLAINKLVMNDPFNPHLFGTLRRAIVTMSVRVRGELRKPDFTSVHPDELPRLFADFSNELAERSSGISRQSKVGEVIGIASWAHQKVIELHPFIDGNGRTARLLVDFIFKRAGLPYITDWGAKDDEYKDVVDRAFKANSHDIFRNFLAEKLLLRADDVKKTDPSLTEMMDKIKSETLFYLQGLRPDAT